MTGHQQILRLRARGYKPAAVFVEDRKGKGEWEIEVGALPTVYVGGERPELTDMRFLVGCRVHLDCPDPARAVAWVDRLLKDGVPHIVQLTEGEVYQWRQ